MSAYSNFALCYDKLMANADYKKRADYILRLFSRFGEIPTLLLDVACGTGGFSNQFAKKGIEVIGTDMSEEMLAAARDNSAAQGLDVLYLCQRAEDLDLYGTVDGAVCCMDSINHITSKRALQKAFKKISLFLEPQKLFIFDVNTLYKHQKVLGNNSFILEGEGVFCAWQNSYCEKNNTTEITLDFFFEEGGGYSRATEIFHERAYTEAELEKMLACADFEILGIFDDLKLTPPTDTTQRVYYVVKKTA